MTVTYWRPSSLQQQQQTKLCCCLSHCHCYILHSGPLWPLNTKIFFAPMKEFFLLQLYYCIKKPPNVLKIHLMQPVMCNDFIKYLYFRYLCADDSYSTCNSGISYAVDFIKYLCWWYITWWWICQIPTTLISQNVMLI